jgi:cell division protein ZapA (FtsZ GTPase activity inhibitor)
VDSVRIAVLAALNIADECFRLRAQVESGDDEAKERLEALTRELSEALGE